MVQRLDSQTASSQSPPSRPCQLGWPFAIGPSAFTAPKSKLLPIVAESHNSEEEEEEEEEE